MHLLPIEFLQHIQAKPHYILKYSEGVTYDEFLNHPFLSIDNELMWDAIQQEVLPNKEWIDIIIERELNKL